MKDLESPRINVSPRTVGGTLTGSAFRANAGGALLWWCLETEGTREEL